MDLGGRGGTAGRTARGAGVALLLVAAHCTGADLDLRVETPQERQVLQRDAAGGADVEVRGTLGGEEGEIRAVLPDGSATPWHPLELTAAAQGPAAPGRSAFSARLRLPAGGWHRLEARTAGGAPRTVVERVGVGEVFVVAGQSNSANSSEWRMPGVNDRLSAFDGQRWSRAADPMPGVQDGSRGGSPWPIFGDMIQRALDLPVAIASTGFGGSSVADWQPNAPPVSTHVPHSLYPGLRRRVEALGEVRAVLWHQGEKDALLGRETGSYVSLFLNLKQTLDRDAGREIPWVVARVSFLPRLDPGAMEAVRRAQERLWRQGHALPGPSTDELQGDLRGPDHIHFSDRGLRVHAELWFAAVWSGLFAPRPGEAVMPEDSGLAAGHPGGRP